MAFSCFLHLILDEYESSVVYVASAKEIWDDLSVLFSKKSVPRIY